jgi:fumarate reductase subunit C
LPDGWFLGHPRYRSYVLFAATGIALAIAAAILLRGIAVLGEGARAWQGFLESLGGPILVLNVVLFIGICFFALRFLRLGLKVFSVPIGPLPAFPPAVWLVLQGAPLVLGAALILLIMWGVIL